MSELKFVKTRGQYEAHCTCGWELTAPESQRSMAESNYALHFNRYCAPSPAAADRKRKAAQRAAL